MNYVCCYLMLGSVYNCQQLNECTKRTLSQTPSKIVHINIFEMDNIP